MRIKLVLSIVCILSAGTWATASADARHFSTLAEQSRSKKQIRKGGKTRKGIIATNRAQRRPTIGSTRHFPNLTPRMRRSVGAVTSYSGVEANKSVVVVNKLRNGRKNTPADADTKQSPNTPMVPSGSRSVDQALARIEQEAQELGSSPNKPGIRPNERYVEFTSPAPPLDEWEEYVVRTSNKYQFTDTQNAMAFSILTDLKARAHRYRSARESEFSRCEKIEDKPTRDARLKSLNKPIDAIFNELKMRLDNLPTIQQMHAAEQSLSAPK